MNLRGTAVAEATAEVASQMKVACIFADEISPHRIPVTVSEIRVLRGAMNISAAVFPSFLNIKRNRKIAVKAETEAAES